MAKAIDTKDWVYLCMTANHWGSGKTEDAAIQQCRRVAGRDWVKKYGYVLYHIHPDFEISNVDGTIYTPLGVPPAKIKDTINRAKEPAKRKLQCPRCKKITDTTGQHGKLSCGDCLMDACEVVELVLVTA
jgi:hypothetical protein